MLEKKNKYLGDEYTKIGLQISEQEYRDLPFPSYSLFSDIEKVGIEKVDPKKRNKDIGDLDGVIFGKIVDSLVTDEILPSDIVVVRKKPTGKIKEIIKTLTDNLNLLPNPKSILEIENRDILLKACEIAKYYKDDVKRLAGVENYKDYIKILEDAANKDKIIVVKYIYDNAVYASSKIIKEEPFSLPKTNPERYTGISQVKLTGIFSFIKKTQIAGRSTMFGHQKVKGMLDYILIDHENKRIYLYDLKTGSYGINDFNQKGFIDWNYYVQAALYYKLAVMELKEHPIYKDYIVDKSFSFAYYNRLVRNYKVFTYREQSLTSASLGFSYSITDSSGGSVTKVKKGLTDLVKEYYYKYGEEQHD